MFHEVLMAFPSKITLFLLSQAKTFKVTRCLSTEPHGMCSCPKASPMVLEKFQYMKNSQVLISLFSLSNPHIWSGVGRMQGKDERSRSLSKNLVVKKEKLGRLFVSLSSVQLYVVPSSRTSSPDNCTSQAPWTRPDVNSTIQWEKLHLHPCGGLRIDGAKERERGRARDITLTESWGLGSFVTVLHVSAPLWGQVGWMKRAKADRFALQDSLRRLLCFTITFYFYLHCLEIFWLCVFYHLWYNFLYQ